MSIPIFTQHPQSCCFVRSRQPWSQVLGLAAKTARVARTMSQKTLKLLRSALPSEFLRHTSIAPRLDNILARSRTEHMQRLNPNIESQVLDQPTWAQRISYSRAKNIMRLGDGEKPVSTLVGGLEPRSELGARRFETEVMIPRIPSGADALLLPLCSFLCSP